MAFLKGGGQLAHATVTSGHDEQNLVSSFFAGHGGYFVEVGAYDPVYQSQTYHLELAGWDGLLIEPLPDLAENLRRTRRAQVRQCACVAPQQASQTSVVLVERRGNSTIRFDRRRAAGDVVLDVPAATLDALLEEAGVARVDFLSVDVEGAEPDVLRGINLSRYRPRLILIDDMDRFGESARVLRRGGYRLVRRTGHNAWFVPREEKFPLGLQGRFELAWTYGVGRFLRRTRR